jgi:Skp family chaperone for outer membrane proteins
LSGTDEGVVIPFHVAKAGLWAAQREWMQTSGPLQRLANQVAEQLDRAERDLQAVDAALDRPCWEGQ